MPFAGSRVASAAVALLATALASCGGGGGQSTSNSPPPPPPPPPTQYAIGGTVSGLSGSGLVLQDNGGDNLAVTGNGAFTFATKVNSGGAYKVTVLTQPSNPAQTCTVTNGTGTASGNVTNVSVTCKTSTVTIGGTVSGLSGSGLVLQDNGGDNLAVSANGAFTFKTAVTVGNTYAVTVLTQPSNPTQTCAVTNGTGTASANVTNVSVTCTTVVTIGGTVTRLQGGQNVVLEDNGGDDLTVSANGTGTDTFTFKTALAVGATYAVTVKTQPSSSTQYCVVGNGSGTTGSANVTNVTVMCQQFAYTADNNFGKIYGYTINASSGALQAVTGSPYADGTAPAAVSLAPNGMFAFSGSDNGTKIHAFVINQLTGQLTEVTGSPFSTGFTVGATYPDIAVDPQSKYLYLASAGDSEVAGFSIDPSTGALTALANSPYPAGAGAGGIPAFSPDGKFLYVVNQTAGSVSGYAIDPTTGVLTPIAGSPFNSQGADPDWISFTPDGKYAYVADHSTTYIAAFTVSATGALTPLSPTYLFSANVNPAYLTIDATGSHLYAAATNGSLGYVDAYTINSDGTLTQMTGSPYTVGTGPKLLTIDPSGKFAYVPSAGTGGTGVYGFTIDSTTGALTPMNSGSPFATGTSPQFFTIDPSGRFGYTANEASYSISEFSIDQSTGALTAITGSPIALATNARPFVVSISPEQPGVRD